MSSYTPKLNADGKYEDYEVIEKRSRKNPQYTCPCGGRHSSFSTGTVMKTHFKTRLHRDFVDHLNRNHISEQLNKIRKKLTDLKECNFRTRLQKQEEKKQREELQMKVAQLEKEKEQFLSRRDEYNIIQLHYDTCMENDYNMMIKEFQDLLMKHQELLKNTILSRQNDIENVSWMDE